VFTRQKLQSVTDNKAVCGIAGVVTAYEARIDRPAIERMIGAMVHRGPDSAGCHFGPQVALGIRRLRVIDLVTGEQPITNEDASVWTVLNGEIYNFQSLRDELAGQGHHFATKSDTEVIVHAYEQHGDDFVLRLRGMFALALWDGNRRRLVLARDRLGKKPLLYAERGGELAFASEMQALIARDGLDAEIDYGALGDYLAYGYVPAPATIFRGVRKLPPGHLLVWEQGRTSVSRYWALSYEPKLPFDEAEALSALEAKLDEAVRLRLIADVPLGALLSGGVDSSTVVALMARHSSRVKTFSIGFDDEAYNELGHARRVAERYGTDHHEFVVREDAASVLPKLVRHYGEPYADSSAIPTFYVSQIARQEVTVALNGDGGDENFAGYDRFRAMRLAEVAAALPARELVFAGARGAAAVALDGRTRSRAERFLAAAALPERERYATWVSAIKPEVLRGVVSPDLTDAFARERSFAVEAAFSAAADLGPVDRLLATDVGTYLPGDLLAKMDIASMANSLETRSPFLDHEVVEFASRLPERFKLGPRLQQKYLLKKLARRLVPAENLDRPKMGFGVPVGSWLRGELRELAADALLGARAMSRGYFRPEAVRTLWDEHQSSSADRTLPMWTLLMLELWHREFLP
jgi:asparagine synthase (glutamine-hydrolysing)